MPLSFWLRIFVVCAAGAVALGWLADRATGDPHLRRVVLASFWARLALAAVLFFISDWGWPMLKSLQMGHGLWSFGGDAQAYHAYGQTLSQSWRLGEPAILPEARIRPYSFVVAVIYRLLGSHLLFPLIFNAWCGAMCGLLAYLIAGRAVGERARIPAAWLVAFWPSSFLWSAQLLKDILACGALLASLHFSLRWAQDAAGSRPTRRTSGWIGSWCGLVLAVMGLTLLRSYVGFTLLAATGLVVGPSLIRAAVRRKAAESVRLFGLVASMAMAVFLGCVSPLTRPEQLPLTPSLQADGSWVSTHTGAGPSKRQSADPPVSASRPSRTAAGPFHALAAQTIPQILLEKRRGFTTTGGHALVDGEVEIPDGRVLLRYLPRAVAVAVLAPFPRDWFDWGGSTGMMRLYSAAEMVLIYVLVPSMIWGLGLVFRRCERGGMLLATFAVCLLIQAAIVVTNLGTLFRLRLMFLFPLLIIAAGVGVLGPYQTVGRWFLRLVGNHHTGASDLHRGGHRADSEDQLAADS